MILVCGVLWVRHCSGPRPVLVSSRMRGTVAGLRANLQVLTGGRVEIADSGAVGWSKNPNARMPGEASPRLAVRIRVHDPSTVPMDLVDAAVAAAKPAHVVHRVEVDRP